MERYYPNRKEGLSEAQVQARQQQNLVNKMKHNTSKSYKNILFDNLFTFFNGINIALAVLVASTGAYRNMLFLGVVISNIFIGTFQEVKAKRTLDKIAVVISSKAYVVRNGKALHIPIEAVVLDDILKLQTGDQISSDSILISGMLEVDEALLSGESDVVKKEVGAFLYSGSFVTSGEAYARVDRVGDDNYAAKISADAKKFRRHPSQLRDALNMIIKGIGISIIPLGILMFWQSYIRAGLDYSTTMLRISAALIGMIPEGLVILTSIALTVGVMNLIKHKTLVQELYCLETLARVDTLCLDKTGTITEGVMEVKHVHVLKDDNMDEIMGNYIASIRDDNATLRALKYHFKVLQNFTYVSHIPFSSDRKYSAVQFAHQTYILGAYEIICKQAEHNSVVHDFYEQGYRVLALAKSKSEVKDSLPKDIEIVAFVAIADKIRKTAKTTIAYFKEQGVTVKVISGDNPKSVSTISKWVGIDNADAYLDVSRLTDAEIQEKASEYTVFGRVSPAQKKLIIQSLKAKGHTVGMSGDGVNDVLAFKVSDISIAMASGSDAAKASANLVLLDNSFDALPHVLYEGRRVINNIEKVATLFLTKTIFSFLLVVLILLLNIPYPFIPIQLTMVSMFTIGIPGFVLALEPNHERVQGNFLWNVLRISLPAALAVVIAWGYVELLYRQGSIVEPHAMQLTFLVIAVNGLIVLAKVAYPWSLLRGSLLIVMSVLVSICYVVFYDFFGIAQVQILALGVHPVVIIFILLAISYLGQSIVSNIYKFKVNKQHT